MMYNEPPLFPPNYLLCMYVCMYINDSSHRCSLGYSRLSITAHTHIYDETSLSLSLSLSSDRERSFHFIVDAGTCIRSRVHARAR